MKKMMMIAAMMVATLSANAQFEPGTFSLQPKAGLTVSEITGDDTRAKAGFTAGVEAQYQMKSWFGLAAGVQYAQQGSKGSCCRCSVCSAGFKGEGCRS